MPVYPFSTRNKSSDDEIVRAIKEHCRKRRLNFSALVVEQLRKYYEEELKNGNVQR